MHLTDKHQSGTEMLICPYSPLKSLWAIVEASACVNLEHLFVW